MRYGEWFDPFDPEHQHVHHDAMAHFRAECPVAKLQSGMTVVTRFDDVKRLLQDPRLRNRHAARAPGIDVPPEDRLFFFEYDPPEHVPLRRLVLDLLSRQRAEREAPRTRALFEDLLAPLLRAGGGELVEGLSVPFAGRLMMRVAGFPEEDAPRWRAWIKHMVLSGFSFTNRNERGTGFAQCYPEVLEYLDQQITSRFGNTAGPRDVLDRIANATVDDEPLRRDLQRMILFSIVSGGTNTLVNFLSNTFLSLARDPRLVATLRDDRTLVPAAVEESLRRDSPSMYLTRACAEPFELEACDVAEGDKVLVSLASANRDEAVYPDSDQVRLDRAGQPTHLAFGWGGHLCVGAPIVRVTGATMLNAVLDHVAEIAVEPGTTPEPYLSPQGNGLDSLRVTLRAAGDDVTGTAARRT